MFCRNCGKELTDGMKFCPVCGTAVNRTGEFRDTVDRMFDEAEADLGGAAREVKDTFTGNDGTDAAGPAGGRHLRDDRGLLSVVLLGIITCGIYNYYFVYALARDTNIACKDDGQKTAGLVAYILLSFFTCGFYSLYWEYKLMNRLNANAPSYGVSMQENGTSVLVWDLVGYITCSIGHYVALYILIKNANLLFSAYNRRHGY